MVAILGGRNNPPPSPPPPQMKPWLPDQLKVDDGLPPREAAGHHKGLPI